MVKLFFKNSQLVKSAGSRPVEKRAYKNKKPTLIAGLHKSYGKLEHSQVIF